MKYETFDHLIYNPVGIFLPGIMAPGNKAKPDRC